MCLNKYCVRLTLIFFAAFLVGCVNDDTEGDKNVNNYVSEGDEVPAFVLTSNEGTTLASSSLNGKIYILNFFDTSCPDCQQELKVLQKIYEKYGETVPVLNVPRSQKPEEVTAYWQQAGLTVPFYSDGDQGLYYKFASRIVPRTYIISADGKVRNAFTDDPIASFDTLDSTLRKLLVDNGGDVNLTLKLNVPSMAGEVFVDNEYKVSKLELFFFDADTKKYFDKLTITNWNEVEFSNDKKEEYGVTYYSDYSRLKAGKYDIFAITNFDHNPYNLVDESDLLNIIDATTYKSGVEAAISEKGPVMTNRASSLLGVDLVPYINRPYVLSIDIERVLAKLSIGLDKNTFFLQRNPLEPTSIYAEINITNFKFVNLNTSYYLFRHVDNLPEFVVRSSFNLTDNFGDYNDVGNAYVIDPYFYQKIANNPTAMSEVGGNYKFWFGNFDANNFASMPSAGNHAYVYVLENTVFKSSQLNGYTPGVVFKGSVNPRKVYLYNSSTGSLTPEEGPEFWPATIYLYNKEFYGSIQAVKTVYSSLPLESDKEYTDAELLSYGIKQCKFNMGSYETYYTYWIRHRNSSPESMGPMEYGVVRNNYYSMLVKDITGLGNSVITPEILRPNYPNSYTDIVINP